MTIISALVWLTCAAINGNAAVMQYPPGTLSAFLKVHPIVIPEAPALTPAIAQPSLAYAQMATPAITAQKIATPIIPATVNAKQSGPTPREALPDVSKRSWELFLKNDRVQGDYVDGKVMNDGSVKLDALNGKNRLEMRYIPPLKSALSEHFPGHPQPIGIFDLKLPPAAELARTTRKESGFQLVFPKKVDETRLSYEGFSTLLAKGKFPMMEIDDLVNHWPRLVELKGMAPIYEDIAGTALSIGAGSDQKSSKSEIGWRRDLEGVLIVMLHDFASINGKIWFRDRQTSNPSKVFPAALDKSKEFLNVIIERLISVRPTLRKDLIKQLSNQGPFGRALADELKPRR